MAGHDHSSHVGGGRGAQLPFDYFPRMYWAVVGAAIGLATLVNVANWVLCRQRVSAAYLDLPTPAKPKNIFTRSGATVAAITREISYASAPVLRIRSFVFATPPVGPALLIAANTVVLLVLCFYTFDLEDYWQWETVGYRTGHVALGQLPLLFLLAGKNSIVGFLVGSSYERLNWLHRWAARCLFLTVTLHMAYFFRVWARWDYIGTKIEDSPIVRKGLGAWGVLAWIVFSSMTPIRGWAYEFFVLQHLVSFVAFLAMVYVHTPDRVHMWIWIPVALFVFDRLVRACFTMYGNLSVFHPRRRSSQDGATTLLACRAEFTPLDRGITRLTIHDPPVRWKAGQHVFLSCHSLLPFQSHPFTIASIPQDGRMEFLVRTKRGGTKRFFEYADGRPALPVVEVAASPSKTVIVEGPYGRIRPLRQFDSVVFFGGGIGATFTVPLMRDLVSAWLSQEDGPRSSDRRPNAIGASRRGGVVTRYIHFVWVVRSVREWSWFKDQVTRAMSDVAEMRRRGRSVEMAVSIYITCDASLTAEHSQLVGGSPSCQPGKRPPLESTSAGCEKTAPDGTTTKTEGGDAERAVDRKNESAGGPGDTCCCRTTITSDVRDREQGAAEGAGCPCSGSSTHPDPISSATKARASSASSGSSGSESVSSASSMISSSGKASPSKPLSKSVEKHELAISIRPGRPSPRHLLLPTLECALGETAVVVCGPQTLATTVRNHVVGLSDERAVHKGTGAQGIWLHCEAYGY